MGWQKYSTKSVGGHNPQSAGSYTTSGKIVCVLELGSAFDGNFTGRENIDISAALHGIDPATLEQYRKDVGAFSELGEKLDEPVKTYSSGMVARLAFSIISQIPADIMLIDEALAVGDYSFQQKCNRFFDNFKRQRGTLVLVSHDINYIRERCDRCLLLFHQDNEAKYLFGDPSEVSKLFIRLNDREVVDAAPSVIEEGFTNVQYVTDELSFDVKQAGSSLNETVIFKNIRIANFRDDQSHNQCQLKFELVSNKFELKNLMVGFSLKNSKGTLVMLHDSEQSFFVKADQAATFIFEFQMPCLMDGTYFISLHAVDGTRSSNKVLADCFDCIQIAVTGNKNLQGIVSAKEIRLTRNSKTK